MQSVNVFEKSGLQGLKARELIEISKQYIDESDGLKQMQNLLRKKIKPNINLQDENGNTALHYTATRSTKQTLYLLNKFKTQININSQNKDGNTICHLADEDVLAVLIKEFSINYNLQNCKGETVLHCALNWGALNEASDIIQSNKCNINIKDQNGQTAIDIAKKRGLKFLLKYYQVNWTEKTHKKFPDNKKTAVKQFLMIANRNINVGNDIRKEIIKYIVGDTYLVKRND